MEIAGLKTAIFKEGIGIFILLVGGIIVMGLSVLVLAAVMSLGTYVPALTPVATEGQKLVTGSFLAIMQYPLIFFILLVMGGYAIQRLGWDDGF